MTVLENVMCGRHRLMPTGIFGIAARIPAVAREEEAARHAARACLAFVGLAGADDLPPTALAVRPSAPGRDRTRARARTCAPADGRACVGPERHRNRAPRRTDPAHRGARHHGASGRARHAHRDGPRGSSWWSCTTARRSPTGRPTRCAPTRRSLPPISGPRPHERAARTLLGYERPRAHGGAARCLA